MQRTARRHSTALTRPLVVTLGVVLLIGVAVLLPRLADRDDLFTLLARICLAVTLAQSWNMLAGFAGQMSLGQAAFFGIGALIARTLWLADVPLAVALPLGGLVAMLFALLIGLPTFRLRGASFAIATLGVAEVLRIAVAQWLPQITSLPPAQIASYDLPARYELALAVALAATATAALQRRSPLGLGLAAVREDEEAARATGVNPMTHKLLALAFSSFFAGLAGGVFAYQQVSYYPATPFSPLWSFEAVLITYVGGLGTVAGPLIGALFFVVTQEQLALTLDQGHQLIFGLLFILVVLAFPGGLVAAAHRLRERFRV